MSVGTSGVFCGNLPAKRHDALFRALVSEPSSRRFTARRLPAARDDCPPRPRGPALRREEGCLVVLAHDDVPVCHLPCRCRLPVAGSGHDKGAAHAKGTRAVVKHDIGRRGRDAHCCAPPAQIRTWTLIHPAPTSGTGRQTTGLACGFPYPIRRLWHACPTLRSVRALASRIPLG